MEMSLEDGGSKAALGGGAGCRLKIAVAVLGSGGSTRTCDNSIGINIIKAVGLLLQLCVVPMEITYMDMEDEYKKYGTLSPLR